MLWLDRLTHSENYIELEIQESLEHFWPCLFSRYVLYPQLEYAAMPSAWMPDIFAAETESEHGSILIIELKGQPPCAGLNDTIDQVVGYGQWYHENHPKENLRLAVIGPWHAARLSPVIERDGYDVSVFQLQQIGHHLAQLSEQLLLWAIKTPLDYSGIGKMEDAIYKQPAVTALVSA